MKTVSPVGRPCTSFSSSLLATFLATWATVVCTWDMPPARSSEGAQAAGTVGLALDEAGSMPFDLDQAEGFDGSPGFHDGIRAFARGRQVMADDDLFEFAVIEA